MLKEKHKPPILLPLPRVLRVALLVLGIITSLAGLEGKAHATVQVVRFPSGTPVAVCGPLDSNANCTISSSGVAGYWKSSGSDIYNTNYSTGNVLIGTNADDSSGGKLQVTDGSDILDVANGTTAISAAGGYAGYAGEFSDSSRNYSAYFGVSNNGSQLTAGLFFDPFNIVYIANGNNAIEINGGSGSSDSIDDAGQIDGSAFRMNNVSTHQDPNSGIFDYYPSIYGVRFIANGDASTDASGSIQFDIANCYGSTGYGSCPGAGYTPFQIFNSGDVSIYPTNGINNVPTDTGEALQVTGDFNVHSGIYTDLIDTDGSVGSVNLGDFTDLNNYTYIDIQDGTKQIFLNATDGVNITANLTATTVSPSNISGATNGTLLCKKSTGAIGYCATLVGVVCASCT